MKSPLAVSLALSIMLLSAEIKQTIFFAVLSGSSEP